MNEFRFTQAEDLFKLFGNINEYSNFGGLFDHHYSHIRFDMEGVGTINSSGVRSWVENIKEFDGKVTFIHCPVTVVDQFNMIPEFMGRDPWVESFYGLFFSPNSNYEETILLEMDKNFDPRSCEFLDSIICPLDNTEMEPDFDTEEYFLFLGQIVESMDKKNEAALENELEIKKDAKPSVSSRNQRKPIKVAVTMPDKMEEGLHYFMFTENISNSGVFLNSNLELSKGDRFKIEFLLPGRVEHRVSTIVEVKWRQSADPDKGVIPGVGVEFVELDKDTEFLINKYINSFYKD